MALSGICKEKFDEYVAKIDGQLAPSIDVLKRIIAAIVAVGGDPKSYPVEGKGNINVEKVLADINSKRNEAVEAGLRQFESQCQPYQDVAKAQAVFNGLEVLATGGLSLILKDQLKVDLKEVIKDGKILGGDNSVANQIRAAILGTLITGDLRRAIEDPGKVTIQSISDIAAFTKHLEGEIRKVLPGIELPNLALPHIDLPVIPHVVIPPLPSLPPLPPLPPLPQLPHIEIKPPW